MEYGFILKISNKKLYKEIQLPFLSEHYRVGMTSECDVRLDRDDFFENFELDFKCNQDKWKVSCSDNVYLDTGDVRKLITCELKHGDSFLVRYQEHDYEVFKVEFTFDFDNEPKKYDYKIYIANMDYLSIGNERNCNIILQGEYVKGDVLEIEKVQGKLYLKKKKTLYGIYKNGVRMEEEQAELKDYTFFSIANFHFYYKKGNLYTDFDSSISLSGLTAIRREQSGILKYPMFNRSSRINTLLPTTPVEILDPPEKPEKPESNLLLTLLPTVAMLILTIVVRGFMSSSTGTFVIFSACTMGMGIVTSLITYVQDKKKYKEKIENREKAYKEYILQKRDDITQYRRKEKELLEHVFPNMQEGIGRIREFSGELFEKTPTDEDFLCIRFGTGNIEAVRKISYKNQERFVSDDELTYMPQQVSEEFKYLENAPVTVNLRQCNAIGIIGEEGDRYEITKNLIIETAVHHYFEDVKFVFIMNQDQKEKFSWVRLLPHTQNDGTIIRNIACDEDSKTGLFESLYKEFSRRAESKESEEFEHLVVFVLNEMKIKTHPISKFIGIAASIHVTFIFLEEYKEQLPLWCTYLVCVGKNRGVLVPAFDENGKAEFSYKPITWEEAKKAAFRLAPVQCEKINLESSLAKSITLFEVLNIYNVDDLDLNARWKKSQVAHSMAAPLGVKTKNEIVYLDLHEKAHGPHGLVAGTTGSGKSEILQSYILSMATLFHPYEIGFMIIDFKGGGMANQFQDLPHMLGSITNIDGSEINRSLLSIRAELLKRQSYFAEAEVNHIDKYILKYQRHEVEKPLPHLIIIVDEFAELKAEFPDFMKELISTARIGRSLGVHLILATQKPSGQVNEQIWSNSRFKLCLKVQTPEDSNEMIKSPLAAEILEPGRAYFQVGNNEIFELFQSGFSGASEKSISSLHDAKSYGIYHVDMSGKRKCVYQKKKEKERNKDRTQLEAIVAYIKQYCHENGILPLERICMPPLPVKIDYPTEIKRDAQTTEIVIEIGKLDDPSHQRQDVALVNLSAENTMVIGSSQYGKTNLLQSIIRGIATKYSPAEVNIYILDFASMVLKNFETLHHVGGVVCSNDDEQFKNLFKLLLSEIVLRKEKLVNAGVSSFVSYRETGKNDLPQIVLLVDNYTAVKELYLQEEDPLLQVCREGLAVGISVVLCNQQTAGLGFRYLSNFAKRIAFYCNESSEYSGVIERSCMVPKNVAGRAITEVQKNVYEMQTYLSFEGEKEVDRVKSMRSFIERMNVQYGVLHAKKIPAIPAVLRERQFVEEYQIQRNDTYIVPVGLDYEEISAVTIDLLQIGTFSIIGRAQSGKSNLLYVIFEQLYKNMFSCPTDVYLLDGLTRGLHEFKEYGFVKEYSIDSDDLVNYIENIYEVATERYEAMTKEEIDLKEEALMLVVVENEMAIQSLCRNADALKKYKELTGRLKAMKVCFIYSNIENVSIPYSAPEILKDIKDKKNFFFLNDLQNLKICDVSTATLRSFKKKIGQGDGYWLSGNEISKIKIVKTERQV